MGCFDWSDDINETYGIKMETKLMHPKLRLFTIYTKSIVFFKYYTDMYAFMRNLHVKQRISELSDTILHI